MSDKLFKACMTVLICGSALGVGAFILTASMKAGARADAERVRSARELREGPCQDMAFRRPSTRSGGFMSESSPELSGDELVELQMLRLQVGSLREACELALDWLNGMRIVEGSKRHSLRDHLQLAIEISKITRRRGLTEAAIQRDSRDP